MVTTLNNLSDASLPTQPREPQWWEGGHFPPLALRESETISFAPRPSVTERGLRSSAFWHDLGHQIFLIMMLTLLCVGGYYFVSRFIATSVIVQGRSMLPTLQDGERFILNRLSYFYHQPKRGDLVVVKDPGHKDYAIKRIVGMPRETLHFRQGEVLLNGQTLLEPYLVPGTKTLLPDFEEKIVILGKDQYFVLGDNRSNSEDSRFYGAVSSSRIVGSIIK